MKAKDYADHYRRLIENNGGLEKELEDPRALREVYVLFAEEGRDLALQRHVKTAEGLSGVMRELDQKWAAFSRLVPEAHIKPNGFRLLTQMRMPETRQYFLSPHEQRAEAEAAFKLNLVMTKMMHDTIRSLMTQKEAL